MSSQLQVALTALQENDYASLAVIAAYGYDYVLTFSDEVEYIWTKPWTWVSTLFVFVRYCGLYNIVISMLLGSSILPGPEKGWFSGEVVFIIEVWSFLLFTGAADFVAILRVWVVYGRSRIVLIALLALFFMEMISMLVIGFRTYPKNLWVLTTQILNVTTCNVGPTVPVYTEIWTALELVHGVALCLLVIVRFMRQSFQMYRATKQWQYNRFISLFTQQGLVYFFAVLLFDIINVLAISGKLPTGGWQVATLLIVQYLPIYVLSPRFILSMRELYAWDRGGGVDTAFGLSYGRGTPGTAVVFADVEELQQETMEIGATH